MASCRRSHGRARSELRKHVEAMRQMATRDPPSREPTAVHLRALLANDVYAKVSDGAGLDQLPADEAAAWRSLWAESAKVVTELAAK